MAEHPTVSVEGTLHSVNGEGVVQLKGKFRANRDDVWSALTDPQRLVRWFGKVEGDLRVNGVFTAFVFASEWKGHGRIDACAPQRQVSVTMWEQEGVEHVIAAELIKVGDPTTLALEVRGLPLDVVWAYGAGWQVHLEDLGAHLSGQENRNLPTRWDELEPIYREMTVSPL